MHRDEASGAFGFVLLVGAKCRSVLCSLPQHNGDMSDGLHTPYIRIFNSNHVYNQCSEHYQDPTVLSILSEL